MTEPGSRKADLDTEGHGGGELSVDQDVTDVEPQDEPDGDQEEGN